MNLLRSSLFLLAVPFLFVGCQTTKSAQGTAKRSLPASSAEGVDQIESENIYEVTELDRRPQPITQGVPRVPSALNKPGTSAQVELSFVILTNGRTSNFEVIRSTSEAWSRAVVDAISDWRFEPAMLNGRPVNCRVKMTVPLEIR
jgi:TonB family protein